MRKFFIIFMWLVVLLAIGWTIYKSQSGSNQAGQPPVSSGQTGAAYADVPWKHLQHVPQFDLKNQENETFDSATLAGQPYAVSFFFATCPSICRDLNAQVKRLNDRLKNETINFVSITVDPRTDTPAILKRYAQDYDADPARWSFLTGQMYEIEKIGEHVFRVVIDKATHTDNILLVDKWGRYRDRFKWDDPYDMARFVKVAKDLAAETKPPLDKTISTRNVLAGIKPNDYGTVPWLYEFHLTNAKGEPFFSRDLTGKVWLANFFFTSCPGICKQQNQYLLGLQQRLVDHPCQIVSISTDPKTDTPGVLDRFATELGANRSSWQFCTGPDKLTKRIGTEFFTAQSSGEHHSSLLFVVDKWGNVRGEFDWQDPAAEGKMLKLIDQLNAEMIPPASFTKIRANMDSAKSESGE